MYKRTYKYQTAAQVFSYQKKCRYLRVLLKLPPVIQNPRTKFQCISDRSHHSL